MTPEKLQELFGTEIGRVYSYTGSIPDNKDASEHITHAFADAAGTNLVDCMVTNFGSGWLLYTRHTTVTSDEFSLVVELPLPEPEVQQEQQQEEQQEQQGGTP
jgi:hypothetical protein